MNRKFIQEELFSRLDWISNITTSASIRLLSDISTDKTKKKELFESLDKIEDIVNELRNLL